MDSSSHITTTSDPQPPRSVRCVTAGTFEPLRAWAIEELAAGAAGGITVIVPRRHLRDELLAAAVRSGSPMSLTVPLATMDEVLRVQREELDGEFQLTPVMQREVLQGILTKEGEAVVTAAWPGGWDREENRPAGWVVDRVLRLMSELDVSKVTAKALRKLAREESDPLLRVRKDALARCYAAWTDILTSAELYPEREGVRRAASTTGSRVRPSWIGDRIILLGFDGVWSSGPESRLIARLTGPTQWNLAQVDLLCVRPDDSEIRGWSAHGNDTAFELALQADAELIRLPDGTGGTRTPALKALWQDPTAYRLAPADWDGTSVTVTRYRDAQQEAAAVADQIKRRIVTDGMSPSSLAIIGRGLGSQSALLQRALREVGVPVVASGQTRLRDVPIIQHVRAWAMIAAEGPQVALLERLAGTGYWRSSPLELSTLRRTLQRWGLPISTWEEWDQALSLEGPETAVARTQMQTIAKESDTFWAQLATIAARSQTMLEWARTTDLEGAIHAVPAGITIQQIGMTDLVRADLDAMRSLLLACEGWARGRELANLAAETVTARQWLEGFERIIGEETIRLSTYGEDGVSLIDPHQAIQRTWSEVYVLGLADGVWPPRPDEALADWDSAARRRLGLTMEEERAAHDRLVFHASCASATQRLHLSCVASDAMGQPALPSPYLTGLQLRLSGAPTVLSVVPPTALVPTAVSLSTSATQNALASASLARRGESTPWVHSPLGRQVASHWRHESVRAGETSTAIVAEQRFHGDIGDEVNAVWPEHRAFSPSDLEIYQSCPLRFWQTRVLQLGDRSDSADSSEDMIMSRIQQDILTAVYTDLQARHLFPATSPADVVKALQSVAQQTTTQLDRARGKVGAAIWHLEHAPLLQTLQRFVRRDLSPTSPREGFWTRLTQLGWTVGTPDQPIVIRPAGSRSWNLTARIDRIESVSDVRFEDNDTLRRLQGMLLVTQYRARRRAQAWEDRRSQWIKGERIALPLMAVAAAEATGQRVIGIMERTPMLDADPAALLTRQVIETDDGTLKLIKVSGKGIDDSLANPVQTAMDTAIQVATEQVEGIRRGDFTPREKRNCWSCPLNQTCRASTVKSGRGSLGSVRDPLPLAVNRLAVT